MPNDHASLSWKGPTIRDIAEVAGVGPATVDRVLNNRPGVRERTRKRVLAALEKLSTEVQDGQQRLDLRLFCDSGEMFNEVLAEAVTTINRSVSGVAITGHYVSTSQLEPEAFARKMVDDGLSSGGVLLVAREHPAINRAVRRIRSENVPVICLTTDLPGSRRSAYVGNDQYAAGSVAGLLIGKSLLPDRNRIMIVMSVPFRCQQEREMGFRRVLRAEFPQLRIEERVISDDQPETTYEQLSRYFEANGLPAAIYNVGGANRGVAKALEQSGNREAIFVGHELTPKSRQLLERGLMDYVIAHDFEAELAMAVRWIQDSGTGLRPDPSPSQILICTRYNCGL